MHAGRMAEAPHLTLVQGNAFIQPEGFHVELVDRLWLEGVKGSLRWRDFVPRDQEGRTEDHIHCSAARLSASSFARVGTGMEEARPALVGRLRPLSAPHGLRPPSPA